MSVMLKARLLWVLPLAVVGSWLVVRTLGASTIAPVSDSPPALAMATSVVLPASVVEVKDAALSRHITRLAAKARKK